MTGPDTLATASSPSGSAVDALVAAGSALVDAGLSPGSSGNISLRDGDRIAMSATGTSLGSLTVDDVSVLDGDGRLLAGPRPSKEVALHTAMYTKNPGHGAAVHVHSPSAVAWSCLEPWSRESAIPPLTPYVLMRVGQVPLLDFVAPGDPAMADLVLDSPLPFHGALLANHGAVVSAIDVRAAVTAAIEVEEACRIALLTDGRARRLLSEEQARALTEQWGTPWTVPSSGAVG